MSENDYTHRDLEQYIHYLVNKVRDVTAKELRKEMRKHHMGRRRQKTIVICNKRDNCFDHPKAMKVITVHEYQMAREKGTHWCFHGNAHKYVTYREEFCSTQSMHYARKFSFCPYPYKSYCVETDRRAVRPPKKRKRRRKRLIFWVDKRE